MQASSKVIRSRVIRSKVKDSQDVNEETGLIKQKAVGRTPGTRPESSIKTQRLAEEAIQEMKSQDASDKTDEGQQVIEEKTTKPKKQKK